VIPLPNLRIYFLAPGSFVTRLGLSSITGPRVVEACLQAGCHYVDISGEQAWIRDVAENWGPKFAQRGLLIAPATAYMSGTSDIAAHFCIEAGGIDTLEVVSLFKGIPTFGSTQTIFAVIQTEAFYLEQNPL